MDVYSALLYQELGLDGVAVIPVSQSYVCVIRCVDVYASAGLADKHFRLKGPLGQTIWPFQVDTDTSAHGQWTGRQIIQPGDSFSVETDGQMDVTISGYLLYTP